MALSVLIDKREAETGNETANEIKRHQFSQMPLRTF